MGADPSAIRETLESARSSVMDTLNNSEVPGRVKEQVQGAAAAVSSAAADMAGRLTEVASTAGTQVQASAADVTSRVTDVAATAKDQVQSGAWMDRLASIDPRISTAVGIFALGYIIGLTVGRR